MKKAKWFLAAVGLLFAAFLLVAWVKGGPQPVHTIEQPLHLPAIKS